MTIKRNKVEAASLTDFNAFLSLYSTILLKYNTNNIKLLKPNFAKWYAEAKPFLDERPDIAAVFEPCYKIITLLKAPKPEQVEALASALNAREFLTFLDHAIKVPKAHITLLKVLSRHALHTEQEKIDKTWDRVHAQISLLSQPALNAAFTEDTEGNASTKDAAPVSQEIQKAAAQCAALVKSVSGSSSCYLTQKAASELRASDPTKFALYSRLNTLVNNVAKVTIKRLIMQSGKPMVPISVLVKQLQSKGVQHNLPVGFIGGQLGFVAGKIVAYTAEGKELSAVPYGTVRMNPAYDPKSDDKYVLSQVNDIRKEYRTLSMNTSNKDQIFQKAAQYTEKEAEYRSSWLRDMMLFDPKKDLGRPQKDHVLAALLELLYVTRQRIGGKSNATKGEDTFGLTTLQVNHIEIKPNYILYSYSGKKGTNQSAKIPTTGSPEAIKLGQIITALISARRDKQGKVIPAKGPTELVFTHRIGGHDKPVPAGAVRTYMKQVHNMPIGPHGFRHSVATEMAKAVLAKAKFKPGKCTQAEVNAWVLEALKVVGHKLHHRNTKGEDTAVTAIKSYIDPEVMHSFYERLGLRTISGVPKRGEVGNKDEQGDDE